MAVAGAAVVLAADFLFGRIASTLESRAAWDAELDVARIERRYRVEHLDYHHDLRPEYDGPARWGPIRYTLRTNSLGFRDFSARTVPVRGQGVRWLLIGDSFTEGVGVNYESTFAGLLAARLASAGIEVLNAGVVSYSPVIYHKKVERLLEQRRLEIDAVVVFLDVSDIQDEVELYHLDSTGRVIGFGPFENTPLVEDRPELSWRRLLDPRPRQSLMDTVASNSLTFHGLVRAAERLRGAPPGANCAAAPDCASAWTMEGPAMEAYGREGLRRADAHMTQLAGLLRARQIPFTVVVYPWPAHLLSNDRPSLQVTYWRRWADRERVGFLELFTPFFAEADALGTEAAIARYFLEADEHWNAAGHALVASAVIDRLRGL
jgi:hypothetical protein